MLHQQRRQERAVAAPAVTVALVAAPAVTVALVAPTREVRRLRGEDRIEDERAQVAPSSGTRYLDRDVHNRTSPSPLLRWVVSLKRSRLVLQTLR